MTIEEFVFDTPLYQVINHNNGYDDFISSLVKQDPSIEIEGYNPIKKCDTTFYLHKGMGNLKRYSNSIIYGKGRTIEDGYEYSTDLLAEDGIRSIVVKCKRYGDTITIIVYHSHSKNSITKVGQYPSVADVHIGQIKQYDKLLDKSILKEFTKAIGLAANGVGIGSFVYLRRIFEGLIYDVMEEVKDTIDLQAFKAKRMDEKIDTLKNHLPPFIVENKPLYGILSKGIHELEEEECLAYFDCMRKSIEYILDERIEQLRKKKKEEEIRKSISEIASKIKKTHGTE